MGTDLVKGYSPIADQFPATSPTPIPETDGVVIDYKYFGTEGVADPI